MNKFSIDTVFSNIEGLEQMNEEDLQYVYTCIYLGRAEEDRETIKAFIEDCSKEFCIKKDWIFGYTFIQLNVCQNPMSDPDLTAIIAARKEFIAFVKEKLLQL